jgi:hypothetical protein
LIALGVRAEPTAMDRAAAQALFDEALTLMDAGNAASACPKLEESQNLDPGVGTLLYLAACYEKLGRTASAWATFTEAAYAAKDLGQLDRETIALENAARLKPLLSRLVVDVAARDTEGLVVESDGKPLNQAMWGSEIPVDPGVRRVTAAAPKKQTWSGEVDVPARGVARLTVPELLDAVSEPALLEPVPPPAPPTDSGAPAEPTTSEDPGASQRLWGWVGVGVGSAAVVAGGVFGFLAVTDNGRADDACRRDDPSLCSERGVELGDSAATKANVASVLGGVGAAFAITGAVLVLTAPEGDEVSLSVSPNHHGGALLLGGTF